jgi:hypothetical protein
VPFTNVDTSALTTADPALKILAVQIDIGASKLVICNVYLPPISSCLPGHYPDFKAILDLFDHDPLILGDFNAHHASWFSPRDPETS